MSDIITLKMTRKQLEMMLDMLDSLDGVPVLEWSPHEAPDREVLTDLIVWCDETRTELEAGRL